jgi:NAD(P)-dependent dehydrogenase (short-subunit alcohol dehydrogenase family)
MPKPTDMKQAAFRVVIITGGASGIGLATVRRFAANHDAVVVADLHADRAEAAAALARQDGAPDALGLACDVGHEAQVEATVRTVLDRFGRLDVVVNNAGLMCFKPIVELTGADWSRILNVDLLGAFYFTKQAFLHMDAGGAIVNISSVHAVETEPLVAPYAAAKAALLSLTRSAALEGQPKKIRVNAILPGAVDTPMLWENPNVKSGIEKIDRTEVGTPEQIAAAIVFLASGDAGFVQGAALRVDGGRLSRL